MMSMPFCVGLGFCLVMGRGLWCGCGQCDVWRWEMGDGNFNVISAYDFDLRFSIWLLMMTMTMTMLMLMLMSLHFLLPFPPPFSIFPALAMWFGMYTQ